MTINLDTSHDSNYKLFDKNNLRDGSTVCTVNFWTYITLLSALLSSTRNAERAYYIRTVAFMMISGTSWNFDEVYDYGEYPGKVLPSFVRSANLNMQSCFNSLHSNLNLGMSLRCKQLTSHTESIANGPVNGHCTIITTWCQGSMHANRHGKKRLTFKSPGGSTCKAEKLFQIQVPIPL